MSSFVAGGDLDDTHERLQRGFLAYAACCAVAAAIVVTTTTANQSFVLALLAVSVITGAIGAWIASTALTGLIRAAVADAMEAEHRRNRAERSAYILSTVVQGIELELDEPIENAKRSLAGAEDLAAALETSAPALDEATDRLAVLAQLADGGAVNIDDVELFGAISHLPDAYGEGMVEIVGTGHADTNADLIEVVVRQLVNNSIDHGLPPCQVDINDYRILVTDKGAGVHSSVLNEMWDYSTKGPKSKGKGVGLPLARVLGSLANATVAYEYDSASHAFIVRFDP